MEDKQAIQLYQALFHLSRKMHRMDHWSGHRCTTEHRALHHSQHHLLELVSNYNGTMQQDLAEKMDIRPSSMTELLGKLEQADYIVRKKDEEDQRIMRVFITEKGQQHVGQFQKAAAELTMNLFDCLTNDEQSHLLILIKKVSTNIDRKIKSSALPMCHHQIKHQGHGQHSRHSAVTDFDKNHDQGN
ncbi:MarR family transcriptional regulator [Megasphaera paucivorans]|uniref:DNA-binding transcriptional regulator, MarR family n=1 Tax=Megasphaera paucivorans TaxID=349095 RepID=A0A1G9XRX6_9FIRM|nr:MarR family transcriptional regulator [Megasphaera paucivorans]SDM99271.1 DNA-binding transcriptional regulator, MarR family [Megasphaera paucivorans]